MNGLVQFLAYTSAIMIVTAFVALVLALFYVLVECLRNKFTKRVYREAVRILESSELYSKAVKDGIMIYVRPAHDDKIDTQDSRTMTEE